MKLRRCVVPAVLAAGFLSGCAMPSFQNNVVTKQVGSLLQPRADAPAQSPVLGVFWQIAQTPATIAPAADPQAQGSSASIGGRVVLQTANHVVPKRYKLNWSGLRNSNETKPTQITLRDSKGNRAMVLHFSGDHLRVITAKEDPFPRLTFSTAHPHKVEILVNMTGSPTVEVHITENGMPLFTSPPLTVIDPAFSSLDEVDINVTSDNASYNISTFKTSVIDG